MRILLQQQDTGLYFEDVGRLTGDTSLAMDFVSSAAALEFCAKNKLTGMQIVLKFDEEKCDIVLPLGASAPRPGDRPSQTV